MLSKQKYLCALVLGGSTLLLSCSSDDDRQFNTDGSQPFGNINGTSNADAPAGIAGTWIRNCTADDPDDAETGYTTSDAIFTTGAAIITDRAYTDSGCTIAADPAEFTIDYTLEFTDGTTTTELGDAVYVNIVPESATIDGQTVAGIFASLINLNETRYDLLLIANNMLYFGDSDSELDGNSEQTRPDMIDTASVYERQ